MKKKVSPKTIAKIIGHANSKYVLDIYASVEAAEEIKAVYSLDDDGPDTGVDVLLPLPKYLADALSKKAGALQIDLQQYIICQLDAAISKEQLGA